MLLIYVPKLTNRLGYTINVVMRDILQTEFAITTDVAVFESHEGPRLCYGQQHWGGAATPFLKATNLLFETTIEDQDCRYFQLDEMPMLFPVFGRDAALPFDPFASIFYMLSRYEEYLPHRKDVHGRYMASESIAYRHGFLQIPVVDHWALKIKDVILQFYPDAIFRKKKFTFQQTIDIDAAYSYLHKGVARTCLGLFRDMILKPDQQAVKQRVRVMMGKETDPFDTFDYIIEQNIKYKHNSQLLFFALLGDYGIYDKPTSYQNPEFQQTLQHIGDFAKIGIHGSYYSTENPRKLNTEIQRLSGILHRTIVRNRFHFLRFNIPQSYRELVRLGVRHDYSMGYADTPGFRNGTCSVLPFFDISSNSELDIRLHPFVTMDTTFHTHMGISAQEAIDQYHTLIDRVREVNGTFSCIFHNQNLSNDGDWAGWRDVYEEVLKYGADDNNKD